MKGKQLARRLAKLGVAVDKGRGKGGHWRLNYRGKWSTLAVHGDRDLSPAYVRLICKQLGIDPEEVL